MAATPSPQSAHLSYSVGRDQQKGNFVIAKDGQEPISAADAGEFLFLLDKDLTIALQLIRPDLYFVHAASLEFQGKVVLLAGQPGSGKSTTTWALLHEGFRYLSDELSPIDLKTLEVHPFPRALCLKSTPPAPYSLPAGTIRTPSTLHVPVGELPGGAASHPLPLTTVFFLNYQPQRHQPAVRPVSPVSPGTAAARLFSNTLNALAHSGDGLDGAIQIACGSSCFELDSGDLSATCALIRDVVGESNKVGHHNVTHYDSDR